MEVAIQQWAKYIEILVIIASMSVTVHAASSDTFIIEKHLPDGSWIARVSSAKRRRSLQTVEDASQELNKQRRAEFKTLVPLYSGILQHELHISTTTSPLENFLQITVDGITAPRDSVSSTIFDISKRHNKLKISNGRTVVRLEQQGALLEIDARDPQIGKKELKHTILWRVLTPGIGVQSILGAWLTQAQYVPYCKLTIQAALMKKANKPS